MADTTRRAFLRSYLAPAAGGVGAGLLLPIVGKGALELAPEAVAQIPVVPAALPFSSEALLLRQIRREFHALRQEAPGAHRTLRWADLWVNRYCPAQHQLMGKPATGWTHCVELAETCWSSLARKHGRYAEDGSFRLSDGRANDPRDQPMIALVEAVLTLGNGERFNPDLQCGLLE